MPPEIDAAVLFEDLSDGLWAEISSVAETGSTNADLARRARAGAASGVVLIADHQRSGRGRFARVWQAPPRRSVAVSVLLRPPAETPPDRWLWLPLVAGLAVVDGLRCCAGVDARLKWPNDVLIEGRKVCGILAERVEGTPPAVVIGMGINTLLSEDELPVATATSLALAGAEVAPGEVVREVLRALERWYRRWAAGDDLREAYAARCDTVGRAVRVVISETESVEGEAIGVDADGRLLVRVDEQVRAFSAGDVWHLR
ncbi:MAG: biotin--[acetyl-CoA-carboxylase] ligase [Propionibacteriaceae bacterium]|nr:biotin--[acetyl-CoA-carboxylase] ligase [Propionibacteriaceae bacterium]